MKKISTISFNYIEIFIVIFLSLANPVLAQTIHITDNPRITISNKPKSKAQKKKFHKGTFSRVKKKSKKHRKKHLSHIRPRKTHWLPIIIKKATAYGVDPILALSIAHVESGFNPKAISPKGAIGIMQLIPDTASRFGVLKISNPIQNIEGGIKYIKFLQARFKGNTDKVIAAYNAGEGAVEKYSGIPPYSETREYVRKVKKARKAYVCYMMGKKNCKG